MKWIVAVLVAVVIISVGIAIAPGMMTTAEEIFDSSGGTVGMDLVLALIVNFWPLIIPLGIIVGAVFYAFSRSGQ